MAHQYRIRVKPMVPWPGSHYGDFVDKVPASLKDWVLILGAPVEAMDKEINCGTDMVWPVIEIENCGKYKYRGGRYVCRHQIQIGD